MSDEVDIEFSVPARMRDGVTLRANAYRPRGAGPWPTLLMRTPYGKDRPGITWCGLDPVQAARRGFLVVIQDTRGRFASEGEWDPLAFERRDGYDTVEWAARLPGSNGRVGMYGGSYCGNAQWLAALEAPPALAAISPLMTWSDPADGLFARGGAVELGLTLPWSLVNGIDHLRRAGSGDKHTQARIEAAADEWDRLGEIGYWNVPINESNVLDRHGVPELGGIRALESPEIAERGRVTGQQAGITVPSLHIGGWYDVFAQGTLDNYQAMAAAGRDARLIVGPWAHDAFADPIGEQLFGMRASRDGVSADPSGEVVDSQLRWLAGRLTPVPEVVLPEAPVRFFVMGRNEWRDASSWPPEQGTRERWYLHGDGRLSKSAPAATEQLTAFIYDPADPVPTVGGNTHLWPGYPAGPIDQGPIEGRDDVLIFTSEPLRRDLEVTGRVCCVLHAESSAISTDWVARLCDVWPDGRSVNICDGLIRAIQDARRCLRYEIDLWSTSNVFLRGHRLRVHVTSSSFPRWDRNLNTGNQRAAGQERARQRLYHEATRPSYVELPVQ